MKKNMVNTEALEGRLYDIENVQLKTVQNQNSKFFGQEFWSGTLHIATDEEGLNVIPVHYTFILRNFANGKPDSRFAALEKITREEKTWTKVGKDNAAMLKLTPSAAVNDFYPQGEDRLVTTQRNEGGFINFINTLSAPGMTRNKFTLDIVINDVKVVEPTEDSNDTPYAKIHGLIFDFRKAVMPFDVVARDPGAINYFESLGVSKKEPVFTQVWGEIESTTISIKREVESAFGEPTVEFVERTRREWVVKGAKPVPYDFGTEDTITVEELQKAIADRNVYLETVKANAKAYYANRNNAAAPATQAAPNFSSNIPDANFDF